MRSRSTWLVSLAVVLAVPLGVAAQAATPAQSPAPSATPPTAPAQPPAEQALPPPPPSYQTSCEPECRAGFLCMQGQCISACNPPCADGESCTADRTCIQNPVASVEGPPPPAAALPNPDAERHDGFFLRLALGFGSNIVDAKASDGSFDALGEPAAHARFWGFAMHFSFDIGAAIVDNFNLGFRLQFADSVQPNTSLDGTRFTPSQDSSVSADLFGPSLTYYFMPINIYATAAAGWASINLDDGGSQRGTGSDFGFTFDVGKEFWVGSQWGMGGALRFSYASISHVEQGVHVEYQFVGWGVLFSATYQ